MTRTLLRRGRGLIESLWQARVAEVAARSSYQAVGKNWQVRCFSSDSDGKYDHLTAWERFVMINKGTDHPDEHPYIENKQKGIYLDKATGEVAFRTEDQFDAGHGWPSFSAPYSEDAVGEELQEVQFGSERAMATEVISKKDGLHLGHVFQDGPEDKGGKRFCINGSALLFVPEDSIGDDNGKAFWKEWREAREKELDVAGKSGGSKGR